MLTEPGYATSPLLQYRRDAIRASRLRIKEWDYYYVGNHSFGVALTVADNSYMGLDSISFLNFEEGWEITKSPMQFFTFGRKQLPATSESGDLRTAGKRYNITFAHNGDQRVLTFRMEGFKDGKAIEGALTLRSPQTDSMVIATPFKEDPQAFYYNQKINCMPASGVVRLGDQEYRFDEADSCGVLDWGRGVWTYKNTWYWGSASGYLDGVPFGFNIGYGFGDTSAATENMLFYNGKAHKLSAVTFQIPQKEGKEEYLSPWTFTSDDGRFEMAFTPILDRASKTDLLLLCSDQHQVFGTFTGRATLDDGTVLHLNEFMGFAEKVFNKW